MKRFICLFLLVFLSAAAFPQNAGIVPNENLVVEGIPKIPASLAETVERYTNFRGASLGSWDPVKREMLISTRCADMAQLHLVKMPGGARTQLTFYPDSVSSAQFSPVSGNSFVFSKDIGGNEFFQVYRFDNASGDVTLLTDGKSRNVAPVWSYDGQKLAYGSTRRNGNDVDLYVVEPANSKSDRMLTQLQGGGWEPLDWSPDNRKILVREEISANESYLWIVEASNGEKTLITPKGGAKIAYGGGQFSKDGKGIYVTTDKDSEFQRLAYVDPASKQHNYLSSHISWDVDEFDLSYDGRTIAFVTNEDGFGVLHLLDTKTAKEKPVPDLPKGIASGVRWHKNNRELGLAMIFPNVRGSTGYGKTFLTMDNGLLREGSYKDINFLLDWIQTQSDLDASRVLVTGGSYGGFMTLAVATNYNDRICCSVDVVGPSNLVTFLEHTSGYRQDLRRVEYGDERDPKMRDFLERIAPFNKTKNITKPLFVIAGKNDPRVPASESEQMVSIVRQNGTPVWWLEAKDEGHGFRKKKNQDYQFYATVMFVKEYLLK